MIIKKYKFNSLIALNFIILVLCIYSAFELRFKGDLPFSVIQTPEGVLITGGSEQYNGYLINSVNSITVSSREMIEVVTDASKAGDKISVELVKNQKTINISIKLVPFYTTGTIIIQLLVSLCYFILGLIILLKMKNKSTATVLNLGLLCIIIIILMTWGTYSHDSLISGFIFRVIFHLTFSVAPVIFLHIIAIYPVDRQLKFKKILIILYFIGIILSVMTVIYFVLLHTDMTRQNIIRYLEFFNDQRIMMSLGVLASLLIFVYSAVKTKDVIEKKRIKWLIIGYVIGPLSYILFWVIPQGIMDKGLIPEEYIFVLMLSIPVSYFISIFRYRLFDIDLFIKRSFIYSIVLTLLLGLYIALIYLLSFYFKEFNKTVFDPIIALFFVILFNPLKTKVQKLIDRKFYKISYDFRLSVKNLLTDIRECRNIDELLFKFTSSLKLLLGIEFIRIIEYDNSGRNLRVINSKDDLSDYSYMMNFPDISSEQFYAFPEIIEPGIKFAELKEGRIKNNQVYLIFPAKTNLKNLRYFILLGKRKSQEKFLVEDIDLISTVSTSIFTEIESIKLQEDIIREKLEKEKVDEISQQKSLFLSSISHDLKTPLASIKLYTEILSSDSISGDKKEKYLTIINGEVDRLIRLINNLLNFSRIEKGIKEYSFQTIDLRKSLEQSLFLMDHQIKLHNCTIISKIPQKEFIINGDNESIIEVLINLISNALKYSIEKKQIDLSLYEENNFYCIGIKDYGIGIPEDELKKLFQPYFRTKHSQNKKINGTGLGLFVVKSIMTSHNGFVEVLSEKEKWTEFILKFPIING